MSIQQVQSSLDIQKASLADTKAVFDLVTTAYSIEMGNTGCQFTKQNRYIDQFEALVDIEESIRNPKQSVYLVARLAGNIVASIRGSVVIAWDGAKVCEYGPIAVSPSYQGLGLGTLMVKSCEEYIQEYLDVQYIQLCVANWRASALVPFYSKQGFVVVA